MTKFVRASVALLAALFGVVLAFVLASPTTAATSIKTSTSTLAATTVDPDCCQAHSALLHEAAPPASVRRLATGRPELANGAERVWPRFGVAAEGGGSVLSFGSRAAAREGLPGDLASAGNRFFRGATAKSQDFQAIELPGGGYRLQLFSPANNPGYGKLYVQEIDRTGQVLREYKNTMGPDGLIETKWVHGGP